MRRGYGIASETSKLFQDLFKSLNIDLDALLSVNIKKINKAFKDIDIKGGVKEKSIDIADAIIKTHTGLKAINVFNQLPPFYVIINVCFVGDYKRKT